MYLFIIFIVITLAVIWWIKSERNLSFNERQYLKRRGYEAEEAPEPKEPVAKDARLLSLLESLSDLSPYSRQKAAEDLSRMCSSGRRDPRMFASLVTALDDNDASVRSAVATALGNLGDDRAIEPLERRIENEESIHARASAQKAVEKLAAGRAAKNAGKEKAV
ncbi:MAG TPA: HEAT repeat domain-containing protein [Blastocatellia bacterium]|nr:HEAT repeat domain-containing protein [Blastocatellia bacterium]